MNPLFQGSDHELPEPCSSWINPQFPLPRDILFIPSPTGSGDTQAFVWGFIACCFLIAIIMLLIVGSPIEMTLLFAAVVLSTSVSSYRSLLNFRESERKYDIAVREGTWRLGSFWSSDIFLFRPRSDNCSLIPRSEVSQLSINQERLDLDPKVAQRKRLTLFIHCGLDEREFVIPLKTFDVQDTPKMTIEASDKLLEKKDLLQKWIMFGDISAVARYYQYDSSWL